MLTSQLKPAKDKQTEYQIGQQWKGVILTNEDMSALRVATIICPSVDTLGLLYKPALLTIVFRP